MNLKKSSFLLFLLIGLTIMSVMSSCSRPHKYKIGVSQCSSDDWRSKMNEELLREAMLHDNVEVEIRSAEDSSNKQISDLDYFVSNKFDLIAVAPNEEKTLTPKIKEIYESGLPVIVYDRNVDGEYFSAYQGADNVGIGKMAAEVAASLTENPQIIEIMGLAGSSPAVSRHAGFRQTADSLGLVMLGEAYGNWNYEDGRKAADSLLHRFPNANVVYAHNDRMAIAACDAARKLGRDNIKIIGIDAAPGIGIQAVFDGKIDVSFLYPTEGHQLMRTALSILEGIPYEKYHLFETPAIVDKSNAEILLLQDKALREETGKISEMQSRMISFSHRYASQKIFLYAAGIIILLLAVIIFLMMRYYWNGKKHHRQIELRNEELARQRDELDRLYNQLQEATGSKLTFFTNVSHDLRTPLTLISAPVEQLAEADNLTPKQHTMMQLANKNVKRLQRLINQILDIRKYDSGQLKLNLVNVNLTASMREWAAPFTEIAARRHIKFSTNIPQNPEIIIALDVEKTERILFNLLSNAFKFTPENGCILVALSKEDDMAVIKVADSGLGIPPDDLNNIFDRFFKTDKINPNGSGIGLALSKVFIDMHGGNISVESNEGAGSTFIVKLPIKQVGDVDSIAENFSANVDLSEIDEIDMDYSDIAEDNSTVLIVDDNKDICGLVKEALVDQFSVMTAFSGPQGLRLANKYIPDIVICDVMMPGMSGYEVCNSLKKDPLTSHIPILMLTACSRDQQRIEGYRCGADAYMTKPFDLEMLKTRVRSLIDNRQRIYQNLDKAYDSVGSKRTSATTTLSGAPVDDEFLQKFMDVLESQLSNSELSVEYIAGEVGLSRVQLYRKIKAITNYSAVELIRITRLKRAAKLLKSSDANVSEVAYAVGFSSPSYFSRCYKDFFNESPVDTQLRTSKAR